MTEGADRAVVGWYDANGLKRPAGGDSRIDRDAERAGLVGVRVGGHDELLCASVGLVILRVGGVNHGAAIAQVKHVALAEIVGDASCRAIGDQG